MTSPGGQYASAQPFFNSTPGNVVGNDLLRLQAYDFYDNAYLNRPQGFTLTLRGDDDEEQVAITLPSPKKHIEAVNRFLAVEFDYALESFSQDPNAEAPPLNTASSLQLKLAIERLFRREKIHSKFAMNKRWGLVRGDAIWHITADDTKLPGERISVHTVDPRCYFPIEDAFDPNRISGVYLVDTVQDPRAKDDKTKRVARVQKYVRIQDNNGFYTGVVTTELALYEIGKWDERELKPADLKRVQVLRPPTPLPTGITQIPVYHWKNKLINDTDKFGNSEIAGVEVLFNAMNQSITDEDLTLVMQGLGMYWTNSGPPRDATTGEDTNYTIGPRQVIEVGEGQTFGRVTGVSSVAPFLEHIRFLDESVGSGNGVSDVATGRVEVAVAESGISLMLQLMPLLAANREKELELIGTHDQMLYDIVRFWFPAYEQLNVVDAIATTSIGDAMPVNREQKINEVVGLVSNVPALITLQMAVDKLTELGWKYPDGDPVQALMDDSAMITAAADPYAGQGPPAVDDGSGEPVE